MRAVKDVWAGGKRGETCACAQSRLWVGGEAASQLPSPSLTQMLWNGERGSMTGGEEARRCVGGGAWLLDWNEFRFHGSGHARWWRATSSAHQSGVVASAQVWAGEVPHAAAPRRTSVGALCCGSRSRALRLWDIRTREDLAVCSKKRHPARNLPAQGSNFKNQNLNFKIKICILKLSAFRVGV